MTKIDGGREGARAKNGAPGRSTAEWIGSTPDAAIPKRVRLRVFEAHHGVCALTGRKILAGDKWDLDHRIPLSMGGEHREGNLQPALKAAHRAKTQSDVAALAKARRVKMKHAGIWPASKAKIQSRPFPKSRNVQP